MDLVVDALNASPESTICANSIKQIQITHNQPNLIMHNRYLVLEFAICKYKHTCFGCNLQDFF